MAKILIVDDEPQVLAMLDLMLRAAGYDVVTASDGDAAVEVARRELPDVILLDVNLPKRDGFEVCANLRAEPPAPGMKIVMLTAAYDTVQDAQRGLRIGADEYVVKPFLRDVLMHNIERLVAASQAARAEAAGKTE
ncbi:MAG: response regulator [Deltaproteobacteria bacterium]|nr:response regulator [Deltaproteobacteria bacterium]